MGGARTGKVKKSKEATMADAQRSFFAQAASRSQLTPAFVSSSAPSFEGTPAFTPAFKSVLPASNHGRARPTSSGSRAEYGGERKSSLQRKEALALQQVTIDLPRSGSKRKPEKEDDEEG